MTHPQQGPRPDREDSPEARPGPGRPPRVVVGVDGSPHSLRALDRAADEAARRNAALEVLCGATTPRRSVVPETDTDRERARQAAREVAAGAAERARDRVPGLEVDPCGVTEAPADALVKASRDAELTVIGTRGHGGFRGLLLGSVSLRLAAHAAGPLMVVRGVEPGAVQGPGETVVGLKWAGATEPVAFGFAQAELDGSPVRVVHAWSYPAMPSLSLKLPPKEPSEETQRAAEFVREAVEPFRRRHPAVRVTTEQHQGATAEYLIELSAQARLVVLGVRREQRRLGLQVGPVVHSVLQHARCPVVLVPTD
ncbi:universal stress protein [Streptomyces sp. NHF165]|uniref:universal stress protein n=1 Tax=Streptomyces sp. NHF165 TaxID=2175864 RepID=UPI00132EB454|nr:universal stress protein [Streptomyces sp. NHF165]QHF95853.1 universal stress protein [Streptomyces sp. NHF165]